MIREIRIQDAGGHAAVEPRSRDDYGPKGDGFGGSSHG